MNNVKLLPIVDCLSGDDVSSVLAGLPAWLEIAESCVVIVNPGHVYTTYGQFLNKGFGDRIIPGLKARGEYESLFADAAWQKRTEEAIGAAQYLDQDRVVWDCEAIMGPFWGDSSFDAKQVERAFVYLGMSSLTPTFMAMTSVKHYQREIELHAAIRRSCPRAQFICAEYGRHGWHAEERRATQAVARTERLGSAQLPMLYPQAVGGVDVSQPGGQRMFRPAEALQAARWHGGTVALYPSGAKFQQVAEELRAAIGAEKAGARRKLLPVAVIPGRMGV